MQLFGFLITDIVKTKERSIVVKTVSGNERRLPRSQIEFHPKRPGTIWIPLWLAEKMAHNSSVDEYFA